MPGSPMEGLPMAEVAIAGRGGIWPAGSPDGLARWPAQPLLARWGLSLKTHKEYTCCTKVSRCLTLRGADRPWMVKTSEKDLDEDV